jgi:Ca2+-binding EF-hand superfamily protein
MNTSSSEGAQGSSSSSSPANTGSGSGASSNKISDVATASASLVPAAQSCLDTCSTRVKLNDFWHKKIQFYFNEILDFDNDGRVSSRDVNGFIEMYKHMKNLRSDSHELEKFSKFLKVWIETIMSLSGKRPGYSADRVDTSISVDDFLKYCEHIRLELVGQTVWPPSLHYMSDYIDALFNILDIDNDGLISKKDFLSSYENIEDLKSREQSWHILCERSGIRHLDKKAFNELCIEFIVSTSPKDRGNWIFGTFPY